MCCHAPPPICHLDSHSHREVSKERGAHSEQRSSWGKECQAPMPPYAYTHPATAFAACTDARQQLQHCVPQHQAAWFPASCCSGLLLPSQGTQHPKTLPIEQNHHHQLIPCCPAAGCTTGPQLQQLLQLLLPPPLLLPAHWLAAVLSW